MTNISLKTLSINGFKGINSLVIYFDGKDAVVSGANGTGKTSVYDSVLWLMFGKDSADTKADVKPVDAQGNRISGTDVDVSAVFFIQKDGVLEEVHLRRVLHEVWSGFGNKAEYTRDETLCWINDVPKKVDKEYIPEVCALFGISEGQFKLLTNHTAFMSMHWTERRKSLFSLLEGATPPVQGEGFERIHEILMGNTPEDARKRLMEQRKRQNDQLTNIPARIDELQRTARTVDDAELEKAKAGLAETTALIEQIDNELNSANAITARIGDLVAKKTQLERRKLTEQTKLSSAHHTAVSIASDTLYALERELAQAQAAIQSANSTIETNLDAIDKLSGQKSELLTEYTALSNEQYVEPAGTDYTCPACGQLLPSGNVDHILEAARIQWKQEQAKKIEANVLSGRKLRTEIENLQHANEKLREDASAYQSKADSIEAQIMEAKTRKAEIEAEAPVTTNEEIQRIDSELDGVDNSLASIGTNERMEELVKNKREYSAQIAAYNATIATAAAQEANKKRIVELENERKVVSDILYGIEQDIETLNRYVSARCKLLEQSINLRFENIRWKLFNVLKNGNIEDCCEATVNGVPYGAGLNNAAKINAGIEIIRALSESAGVRLPCFIDNSESVNQIESTGGQMIQLRVTKEYELTCTLID